ncbi:DDE-type integrase/transposase/recombinase [Streptomyces aureus]|uniref:DDE-type integrase/transposase/recombinase n=1 Tax=Streptomyces aureus TaxID=193461 RepID=UPI0031D4D9D0
MDGGNENPREVVGYAMADHHRAGLVVDALRMAAGRGGLKGGCIAHSDRGPEYTSREYRTPIRELGLRQSMGRTGSCYDNAAAESFFGLLKAEIGTTIWASHEAARADVFRFIEVEYKDPDKRYPTAHSLAQALRPLDHTHVPSTAGPSRIPLRWSPALRSSPGSLPPSGPHTTSPRPISLTP